MALGRGKRRAARIGGAMRDFLGERGIADAVAPVFQGDVGGGGKRACRIEAEGVIGAQACGVEIRDHDLGMPGGGGLWRS